MVEQAEQSEVSVAELMSMPVVTIGPDALAAEVLALAEANDLHHFPIIEHERLLGLVCTCDLEDEPPDSRVILKAWRHVVTATPQCSPDDAARLMRLHGVGSVVIADAEGVWGIVTREDLLRSDPELELLMDGARCVVCGARRHLRPGEDGSCWCKPCQSRTASIRTAP